MGANVYCSASARRTESESSRPRIFRNAERRKTEIRAQKTVPAAGIGPAKEETVGAVVFWISKLLQQWSSHERLRGST